MDAAGQRGRKKVRARRNRTAFKRGWEAERLGEEVRKKMRGNVWKVFRKRRENAAALSETTGILPDSTVGRVLFCHSTRLKNGVERKKRKEIGGTF